MRSGAAGTGVAYSRGIPGSLLEGIGEGLVGLDPFPDGSGKLLVPRSFPRRLQERLDCAKGRVLGSCAGSLPVQPVHPFSMAFFPSGERLKGQEGELASAVGSAKQEGSDSE